MKDEVLIRIESIKIELDGLNEVLNKKLDDIEVDLIRFYFIFQRIIKYLNSIFFSSISKKYSIDVKSFAQLNSKLKNEFEAHIEKFQIVWSKCKRNLNEYLSKEMPNSRLTINEDHLFSLDTKLSFFSTSTYGDGFTCYALIRYLSSYHNEFLIQ